MDSNRAVIPGGFDRPWRVKSNENPVFFNSNKRDSRSPLRGVGNDGLLRHRCEFGLKHRQLLAQSLLLGHGCGIAHGVFQFFALLLKTFAG